MRQPESKSSQRRLKAADRRQQALELRKAGASYMQIAKTLGFASESGARKAVGVALAKIAKATGERAGEVLALELQRLDEMLKGLWMQARKGDEKAISRVLAIMERRARYLGLDAPSRSELSGPGGAPLQIDERKGPDLSQLSDEQLEEWERLTRSAEDLLVHASRVET